MYELTCPYCRNVAKSSFVRKGAMARCAQCGRDYLIKPETYRRLVAAADGSEPAESLVSAVPAAAGGAQSSTAGTSVPAAGGAKPAAPSSGRSSPVLPSVRATPLQDGASRQAAARPAPPDTNRSSSVASPASASSPASSISAPTPPPAPAVVLPPPMPSPPPPQGPPPDPDVVRVLARRARRRRTNPAALWLIFFLLLAVFVAVAMIAYTEVQRQKLAATLAARSPDFHQDRSASQPAAAAPKLAPVDPQIAIVVAERLPLVGRWFAADEPVKPAQRDALVELRRENIGRDGEGGSYFEAEVVAQSFEFVETATVNLGLVDENDRVFARTRMNLVLLNSQRSAPVRVEIAKELFHRTARVDARVTAGPKLPGGVLFEDTLIEPVSAKKGFAVKVTAYNPLTQPLNRALFLFTARDARGRAVGQWRANWAQSIGPRQRVEFQAFITDDNAAGWEWEVTAAGASEPGPGS